MDRQSHGQGQPPITGSGLTAIPISYASPQYQQNQLTGAANPGSNFATPPDYSQAASQLADQRMAFQQINQQQQKRLQQKLQAFWEIQREEIERVTDFKNHRIPLNRIKKIMRADEDVRMISTEALIIFAKACEIFIMELTLRAWHHTEETKGRVLQKNDVAAATTETYILDFLVGILPKEDLKDEASERGIAFPTS